ncbi:MAG TPA: hypothetical protein VF599_03570 [Pyrinomonadaceae bacterium]|jgi:hypothetical protein
MKRIFTGGLILSICLLSSACSFIVNFVVVNESAAPIEMEYTLSLEDYAVLQQMEAPPAENLMPAKMDLAAWEGKFKQEAWQIMSPDEYRFDAKTGKLKVKVAPGQAVKILQTSSSVFFEGGDKRFQVKTLEISGESGKMFFEGLQLFKHFSEKDYSNRYIAYK